MDATLAYNFCYYYLEVMGKLQRLPHAQSKFEFEVSWNDFACTNAHYLQNDATLSRQLQMLVNPRFAASQILREAENHSSFWFHSGISISTNAFELESLLMSARSTYRSSVIPTSIINGYLPTWKSTVAEAIIWYRGSDRVRSHTQERVYRSSRNMTHRLKAADFRAKSDLARTEKRVA